MDEHADQLRRLAWLVFVVAVGALVATLPLTRPRGSVHLDPALATSAGALLVVLLFPWTRLHPDRFPFVPLATIALLSGAVALTGGGRSPWTPVYGLVMAVAAAAYPPRALALVTAAAIAGRSGFLLYDDPIGRAAVLRLGIELPVFAAVAVLTAVIAGRLSTARASASLLPYLTGRTTSAVERARSAQTLQAATLQTMVRLAEAVEARDTGTAAHCRRVAAYSTAIAAELHLPPSLMIDVARGALLHDLGKIAIPDAVLLKEGKLTDDEWTTMRRHPQTGYDLLGKLPYLEHARELVYCHHERWDGKGYPRGLKGAAIPAGARVFALADAFDAMSCDRPYRNALPPEAIMDELRRGAGTQFDPTVVDAFLRVLSTTAAPGGPPGWRVNGPDYRALAFDLDRLRRRAAEQPLPGIDPGLLTPSTDSPGRPGDTPGRSRAA